ncbi:MAG TPA: helix-turn-helix domain-containing protein, partial [Actinomycetota bacterium]|nr:helix-turn-helix domain-containing protein [Actinomycetota bacterium]
MSTTPLSAALEAVGDRWSLALVEALMDGEMRFNDLLETVEGIAPNILSTRLKKLEKDGIVRATPYSEKPLRLRYELTAAGKELAGAVRLLAQWGSGRTSETEAIRHDTCGTALEARWYCPTCAE